MVISKIEVNTVRLNSDTRSLREVLRNANRHIRDIKSKMDAMNGMWEGDAKDIMCQRFRIDYENMTAFCAFIDELLTSLETIRQSYDTCENDVTSAVSTLSIN